MMLLVVRKCFFSSRHKYKATTVYVERCSLISMPFLFKFNYHTKPQLNTLLTFPYQILKIRS